MQILLSRSLVHLLTIFICCSLSSQLAAQDSATPLKAELLSSLNNLTSDSVRISYHRDSQRVSFITTQPGMTIAQPFNGVVSTNPVDTAANFLTHYASLFGQRYKPEYSLISNNKSNGQHSVKFRQTVNSIPVFAGEMVVRMDNSLAVSGVNGEVASNLLLSTKPVLSTDDARKAALTLAQKLNHESVFNNNNFSASTAELWIYNPSLIGKGADKNTLVWRMEITGSGNNPVRELVMVDAQNGTIALHYNLIMHIKNREIYDNQNDPNLALPGTVIVRAEGDPAHAIQDVNDAYVYSGDTYDFFFNHHGRDSLDNAGMTLVSTVRYCDAFSGCPMQNAFWNGSQMAYGEGFAVDDIVAHELTHGVTTFTSNLIYLNESGAINESFSDVWGEFVDLTNTGGTDTPTVRWRMGEDVPVLGAIRNMQNPPEFNNADSITSPLYYCGTADNGGVHWNSGVNNKAAYLMVDGDTFNGINVAGIGINKTAKIYYEAQTNILTSGSTYLDLYNAMQVACSTLMGSGTVTQADCSSVLNALDAVEMSAPVCVTLPAPVCPQGTIANDLLNEDFEVADIWTHSADIGADAWSYSLLNPAAGVQHIHGDDLAATSDSNIQSNASLSLPANAYMHFKHTFDLEGGFDGGVVEYTTDGGLSWTDAELLFTDNGYNLPALSSAYGNPLGGRPAFSGGMSGANGYTSSRLDLSTLSGSAIDFRFRIGTDSSVGAPGWDIDDVRIYTCNVDAPNNPPTAVAGADQTVTDNDGNGSEDVTLDGSGSSDSDGTLVNYEWHDSNGNLLATGVNPVVTLPVGTQVIVLTVTDNAGATATDQLTVIVEPVISVVLDTTIDSPMPGEAVNTPVTISGTGTAPDGVDTVLVGIRDQVTKLWWNNGSWGSWTLNSTTVTPAGGNSVTWSMTFDPTGTGGSGKYRIFARTRDLNGTRDNATTLNFTTINDTEPGILDTAVSSPLPGEVLPVPATLTGTGSAPNGVDTVLVGIKDRVTKLWWNNGSWGPWTLSSTTVTPAGGTNVTWSTSFDPTGTGGSGQYRLYARTLDLNGNKAPSIQVSFDTVEAPQ